MRQGKPQKKEITKNHIKRAQKRSLKEKTKIRMRKWSNLQSLELGAQEERERIEKFTLDIIFQSIEPF